jgi:hypothetical protein
LNEAERAKVDALRSRKATEMEKGMLLALRASIADPIDSQLIQMAIEHQDSAA